MKRRDIFSLAGLCAMPAIAAGEPRLKSNCVDGSNTKLTREPFGEVRVYYDGPTDQLTWMTAGSLRLKPGMEPHPPHQHPEEEFLVITEGNGEFLVDGKKSHAGPGSMLYCEGNQLHGVKNTGTKPLLFYFYKWQA